MEKVLGVDVGATGTKAGIVDLKSGTLVGERHKISTPKGGMPTDMLVTIKELINYFDWEGKPIGVGFPSAIRDNIVLTASNIDDSWKGLNLNHLVNKETGCPCCVVNDADAAGLAEVRYGNCKNISGTVVLLTLGTGIGSAVFNNGQLLQNTEFGHVMYKGDIAEASVSNSARKRKDLSWEEYGRELGEFLSYINRLFYPEIIILGGGISKKIENFKAYFPEGIKVKPASQFNDAGIVGAALAYDIYKPA